MYMIFQNNYSKLEMLKIGILLCNQDGLVAIRSNTLTWKELRNRTQHLKHLFSSFWIPSNRSQRSQTKGTFDVLNLFLEKSFCSYAEVRRTWPGLAGFWGWRDGAEIPGRAAWSKFSEQGALWQPPADGIHAVRVTQRTTQQKISE